MRANAVVEAQLKLFEWRLEGLREPDGFLIEKIQDPATRARVRHELNGSIRALRWVLAGGHETDERTSRDDHDDAQ